MIVYGWICTNLWHLYNLISTAAAAAKYPTYVLVLSLFLCHSHWHLPSHDLCLCSTQNIHIVILSFCATEKQDIPLQHTTGQECSRLFNIYTVLIQAASRWQHLQLNSTTQLVDTVISTNKLHCRFNIEKIMLYLQWVCHSSQNDSIFIKHTGIDWVKLCSVKSSRVSLLQRTITAVDVTSSGHYSL